MMRWSWSALALLLLAVAVLTARTARADTAKPPVVIWPTLTPAGDAPSPVPLHRPLPPADRGLYERSQELEATLRDAVQDLGFTLFVADPGPAQGHTRDEDLIERAGRAAVGASAGPGAGAGSAAGGETAGGTWVVSPRIESAGAGGYIVRIVAVPPRGRELRVRVETVASDAVSVRGLVMLRDLLTGEAASQAALEQERLQAGKGSAQGVTAPARSEGRAVLAVSGGLFGAFTAFSLEAAATSTEQPDPRVLYPLLALGTGIGVGGALLAADEWDLTTGDAWYLAAGTGWAAASGFLVATGSNVQPSTDAYSWAVGGGLAGLGLATFALTRGHMDDGDAVLTHSGAALGMLAGGTIDWLGKDANLLGLCNLHLPCQAPYLGMGYGSAVGLVAAGLLATQVTTSPSRVLLIDVGAGGGALIGAAAASPLIFNNVDPAHTRAWLSVTLAGTVVGGGLAWWLTRDVTSNPKPASSLPTPTAGVLGTSITPRGEAPIYGAGVTGRW
jgi:hypothetical protein